MRTSHLAGMSLLLLLGCGGRDLLDPPSGIPVYQLRDVDGEALPVVTDSIATFRGMVYVSLEDAEMVLLADSVAEMVTMVRTRTSTADSVVRRSVIGPYWVEGDTLLVWCPIFDEFSMFCTGGRYAPGELVVRSLSGFGRRRDHRFTVR